MNVAKEHRESDVIGGGAGDGGIKDVVWFLRNSGEGWLTHEAVTGERKMHLQPGLRFDEF